MDWSEIKFKRKDSNVNRRRLSGHERWWNYIQSNPIWLLNRGCCILSLHVPILLQMVFTAPRQWLYEGSTDGIYMVAGHRDAGACSSHQKLSHLALYIRVRVHNATNKYVPWKCVIRLYIVRPYTTGVGALLIHLSRHSFAWKPPSTQPASGVTSVR